MTIKSEAEINAEKATKPAMDVVPPELGFAAGRALGYGKAKHGVATADGWGTWRVAGTQQAEVLTHYSCLMRHLGQWRAGEACDAESGLSHLDHAAAQLAIMLDLVARPLPVGPEAPSVIAVAAGLLPKDPDNDADWPLPEGFTWAPECGPDGEEWYAEGPNGTICSDPDCCRTPPEVAAIVRAREAARK